MKKNINKSVLSAIFAAAAILIAYSCRMISKGNDNLQILSFIRSIIYLTLFMAWGVSLKIRIHQKQVKKYMLTVSILVIFWIFIRTLKFHFVTTPTAFRYIWYLYYLPMLFIPTLGLLVVLSIGKPDDYKLPEISIVLWIVPAVLLGFVMTNDLHQLVFTFPSDLPMSMCSDKKYDYNFLFKLITVWEVCCPIAAFIIMIFKCRTPGVKKFFWLPPVPLALSVLYIALYGFGFKWFFNFFGDMTVIQSLLIAAVFEACIRLGLINSNSHYTELFYASDNCSAQITDQDFNVKYVSHDAVSITRSQMQSAEKAPLRLENGYLLHTAAINGGYAVWTEDNSELLTLTEELEDLRQELKDRCDLLRYEYKCKETEEQNRLYDLLQSVTQKQIDKIAMLVKTYQTEEKDSETSNTVLAKIAVLCSFIKRRKHLVLLVYKDYDIPFSELNSAFKESLCTLELLNVRHSIFIDTEEMLHGSDATVIYDFFEDVVETGLDTLISLNIRVVRLNGILRITVFAQCSADLSVLQTAYPNAEFDKYDDEWTCLLTLKTGGDAE